MEVRAEIEAERTTKDSSNADRVAGVDKGKKRARDEDEDM